MLLKLDIYCVFSGTFHNMVINNGSLTLDGHSMFTQSYGNFNNRIGVYKIYIINVSLVCHGRIADSGLFVIILKWSIYPNKMKCLSVPDFLFQQEFEGGGVNSSICMDLLWPSEDFDWPPKGFWFGTQWKRNHGIGHFPFLLIKLKFQCHFVPFSLNLI